MGRRGWIGTAAVSGLLLFGAAPAGAQARATLLASGLDMPLYATAPEGDARVFVVEEEGRIRVLKNGSLLATPFLDISAQVSTSGEGGLLGMAFPPDYASSGLFYVYYTNLANDSVVARFSVSANPDVANAASQTVLLLVDQPDTRTNHRGGTIHIGPDGFLWFATGDGGGSDDPDELAQNPQSLLGKMLRIDVGPAFAPGSLPVAGQLYRIPADNPFVGAPPRDEIWALGFRNPFRWSFDRFGGDLWIGDVGQGAREEIDFEPANDPGGRNYGWDVMEGTECGDEPAPSPPCGDASLTPPVHEYDHAAGDCTVIGGFVYHGDSSPLRGLYFFGDFCSGRVWTLDPASGAIVDRTAELGDAANTTFDLVGFGEDGFGRLLLVKRTSGTVYRIRSSAPPSFACGLGPELAAALAALSAVRLRARARARAA